MRFITGTHCCYFIVYALMCLSSGHLKVTFHASAATEVEGNTDIKVTNIDTYGIKQSTEC